MSERRERVARGLYAGHLGAVFGLALSNALLGLTLLVTPWRRRLADLPWASLSPLLLPLGVYVLTLGVAVGASLDPRASLRAASELFSLMTLGVALLLVHRERDVRLLVDLVVAVVALCALFGLAQFLWGYGDLGQRIRGPFSHYMTFAGVLLVGNLLLLGRMLFGDGGRRAWTWVALAVINLALIASLTRSAWVGFAAAFMLLLALRAPRLVPVYAAAVLVLALLAPGPVVQRLGSIVDVRDVSNYDRLCMAEAGFHMIGDHPFTGLGPYMVREVYPIYRHPTAPRLEVPHLHNSFVQVAAERGLPALAAYLWLAGAVGWTAWRRYRLEGGRSGPRADLYLAVVAVLVGFNLAGLFEHNWGDTEVQRLVLFTMAIPFLLARPSETAAERGADA